MGVRIRSMEEALWSEKIHLEYFVFLSEVWNELVLQFPFV